MVASTQPLSGRSRGVAFGVVVGCVIAWLVWTCVLSSAEGGVSASFRSPYAVGPVVLSVGLVIGGLASRLPQAWLLPPALAVVLFLGVVWTLEPGKAPLGYANANAALSIQVIGMAGAVAVGKPTVHRATMAVTAALCVAVVVANSSRVGIPLALGTFAVLILALTKRLRRRWPMMLLALAGVGGAWYGFWLLVTHEVHSRWASPVADPTRWRLWQDALRLWEKDPERGSGPGSFARFSRLAGDPDTSSAHSLLLQVGAEVGWIGLGLLAAIWVACLVLAATGPARAALPVMGAWSALGVHSLVDHLVDFPPVLLVAGVALGWASQADWRRSAGPCRSPTQKSSTSPRVRRQSLDLGGAAARARVVSSGPCRGSGKSPPASPERTPMA